MSNNVSIDRHEGSQYFFDVSAGTHIREAIREVIDIVKQKQCANDLRIIIMGQGINKREFTKISGVFKFNGLQIEVFADSNVEKSYEEFQTGNEERRAKYDASPEGIAAKAKAEAERAERQAEMYVLYPRLEILVNEHVMANGAVQPTGETAAKLFSLLREYVMLSDNIMETHYRAEVAELLTATGYVAKEYVGPPEDIDTGDKMRAFVAGQLLESYNAYKIYWPALTMHIERGKLDTMEPDLAEVKRDRRPPLGKNPFNKE